MSIFRCVLIFLGLSTGLASAEPERIFSFAHIFSNDFIGDGQDRWRTGSFTFSFLKDFGSSTSGDASSGRAILELRLRSEIIAPSNLSRPAPTDRPYAGILSVGVHHHTLHRHLETSLGIDLVAAGEQTGLLNFQNDFHDLFGVGGLGKVSQINNSVYPTLVGEVAWPFDRNEFTMLRPFMEVQLGSENFLRSGIDVEFGRGCRGSFKLRDVATGQRYIASSCGSTSSTAVSAGVDVAKVFGSRYLPSSIGLELSALRLRMRLGVQHTSKYGSAFYGLTWLGREFRGQSEGQMVGSVSISLDF